MATAQDAKSKPLPINDVAFQTDDSLQVIPPPEGGGYDDEPDEHRGMPVAERRPEYPPRNKWTGQPGFDHAEKIREAKFGKDWNKI